MNPHTKVLQEALDLLQRKVDAADSIDRPGLERAVATLLALQRAGRAADRTLEDPPFWLGVVEALWSQAERA